MRTSFDAFLNLNLTADPDVACRFAEGMPVIHPYTRSWVQLQTPLDFLVVSDHAEFLGGIRDIYYNGIQAIQHFSYLACNDWSYPRNLFGDRTTVVLS